MSGLMAGGEGNRGNEGWRCVTCDGELGSPGDVRQHWAEFSEGHSLFIERTTGRIYHQTIEGLCERPSLQAAEKPPENGEDAEMAPSWAFEVGARVVLIDAHASAPSKVLGEVIARGVLEGKRTYLVFTSRLRSPLHLVAEALLLPVDRPADGRNGR